MIKCDIAIRTLKQPLNEYLCQDFLSNTSPTQFAWKPALIKAMLQCIYCLSIIFTITSISYNLLSKKIQSRITPGYVRKLFDIVNCNAQ